MKTTRYAPAKINLCLHVLGKRHDGYHELAMLMQRVSLCDVIEFEVVSTPGVRVCCDRLSLAPGEENIAGRAALLILDRAGNPCGINLCIEKNIPVAAGLGGGSSDAATVLLTLNQLLNMQLSRHRLMELGARLGADVPFFIYENAAWATGIGDQLLMAPLLPAVWYVLVNPGISVSTAQVYRKLGLTSKMDATKLPRFPETLENLVEQLHNDLERVTLADYPVVGEIKQRLLVLGATGVLMSGSGPTVFGVFASEEAASAATAALAYSSWKVFMVEPV